MSLPPPRRPLTLFAGCAIAGIVAARLGVGYGYSISLASTGLLLVAAGWRFDLRVRRSLLPGADAMRLAGSLITCGVMLAVAGGFGAWYTGRDTGLQTQQQRFPERSKLPVIMRCVVVEPASPLRQVPDPTTPLETLTGEHAPAPPLLSGTWDGGADSIRSPMHTAMVVRVSEYSGGEQPLILDRMPAGRELVRVYTDELWPDVHYGEEIEIPVTLVTPRSPGNPGEFDYRQWLRERGIMRIALWHYSNGLNRLSPGGLASWTPTGLAFALRQRVIRFVHTHLSEPHASLLLTITLGLRANLSGDLTESFRRTGTVHLLVISGLHVGLMLVVIEVLLGLLRVPYRARLLVVILLLLFYRELTGGQVAVTRAVVFTTLWYAAPLASRRPGLLNLLAGSALILLAINPHDLFNAGFQLSFGAVIALRWIVLLNKPALLSHGFPRPLSHRLLDSFNGGIASSLAVLIGLTPLLWHWFGISPVSSLVVNLPAVPLMALVVALSVPVVIGVAIMGVLPFTTPLLDPLLAFIAQIAAALQSSLVQIVEFAARQPWSHINLPPISTLQVVAFVVLILAWINRESLRMGGSRLGMATGTLALTLWLPGTLPGSGTPTASATVLDVGQGSCILLRSSDGHAVLVDPGEIWRGDVGRDIILPMLRHERIFTLDAIVLTNPDWSHTSAMTDVLDQVRVRQIFVGAGFTDDLSAPVRLAAARHLRIPVTTLRAGDVVHLGEARLTAIGPAPGVVEASRDAFDDRSLSLLWQPFATGGTALVIAGDIRTTGLDSQIAQLEAGHWPGATPAAAVMLPNFGRPESITPDWLEAWQASAAIAPDGAPPSARLLELATDRCRVLPTFTLGAVRIESDATGAHHLLHWDGAWQPVAGVTGER
ncbi:MAG: ComEC/Rec2 family competence protein [Planctomycetota bacterium]